MEVLYYSAWALLILDTLAIAYLFIFTAKKPAVSAQAKVAAKIAALQHEISVLQTPPKAS